MRAARAKKAKSPIRQGVRRSVPSSGGRQNLIDRLASERLLSRDETIFRKGQTAAHIFKVEIGCVRTFVRHGRGRRLIVALYFPGDYFGLDMRGKHRLSAEAITPSKILAIGRRALTSRAAANAMLVLTNLELQRTQQHSLLLRLSANERVGQFLFEMKKRNRRKEVELAMSRHDMADYLNLTVESVARALTRLKKASAISIRSFRRIAVHIRKPMPTR